MTRILCPVDFSDVSRIAVDHAVAVAQWYDATITAFHVLEPPMVVGPVELRDRMEDLRHDARADLQDRLRKFVEPAQVPNMPAGIDVDIQEGPTVESILERAAKLPADLVVMGTHGRSGVKRLVLGSVTEQVLRQAPCPVMAVPPRAEGAPHRPVLFKQILCPIDFSTPSLRALEHALTMAQEADAHITLLHVLDNRADMQAAANIGFNVLDQQYQLELDAQARLHQAVPEEARTWCEVEEAVVTGIASHEILRVANERQAELIVMGVQGRGAIDLALFGSTTHAVIRDAACPVLSLRAA